MEIWILFPSLSSKSHSSVHTMAIPVWLTKWTNSNIRRSVTVTAWRIFEFVHFVSHTGIVMVWTELWLLEQLTDGPFSAEIWQGCTFNYKKEIPYWHAKRQYCCTVHRYWRIECRHHRIKRWVFHDVLRVYHDVLLVVHNVLGFVMFYKCFMMFYVSFTMFYNVQWIVQQSALAPALSNRRIRDLR